MFIVDRIVAIIRPKQKMLEWLHDQPEVQANFSLQNLQTDCTALLIPPFESPRQAREYIKQTYQGIFEGELISWGLPNASWPQNRTYELFESWFTIEFHSVVLDMGYVEQTQADSKK
ncbi:MAG: hypothetical protein HKM04_02520 [Legionellales bacterium]|nr:hypothetical protein [Legionellales bacterium]